MKRTTFIYALILVVGLSLYAYAQQITVIGGGSEVANFQILPAKTRTALVRANGSWLSLSQTADFAGIGAGDSVRVNFSMWHAGRIRRDCQLDSVAMYIGSLAGTAYTGVHVQVVRRYDNSRFSFVGQSPNLLVGTSPGVRGKRLGTPIQAKAGDYYAVLVRKPTAGANGNIFDLVGDANASVRVAPTDTKPVYPTCANPPCGDAAANGFQWYAATVNVASFYFPVEFFTKPPQMVAIGYSQIEGQNLAYSFARNSTLSQDTLETTDPKFVTTTWDDIFTTTLQPGISFENNGVGGNTSAEFAVRASRDCYALKPRVALVQIGANDTDSALVYNTVKAFLDSCQTRSIAPVVLKMTPMTNKPPTWAQSTLAYMRWRDRIDKSIEVLCAGHASKPICIDADADLGKNRAAGPIGNLWDIRTAGSTFDSGDGLHYTAAGQAAYAAAINNALKYDTVRP